MEIGWLVNRSFSRSDGAAAALSARSYQTSPTAAPLSPALFQGNKSTTPQGFGTARARAYSIAITVPGCSSRLRISIARLRRNLRITTADSVK